MDQPKSWTSISKLQLGMAHYVIVTKIFQGLWVFSSNADKAHTTCRNVHCVSLSFDSHN